MKKIIIILMMAFAVVSVSCSEEITTDPTVTTPTEKPTFEDSAFDVLGNITITGDSLATGEVVFKNGAVHDVELSTSTDKLVTSVGDAFKTAIVKAIAADGSKLKGYVEVETVVVSGTGVTDKLLDVTTTATATLKLINGVTMRAGGTTPTPIVYTFTPGVNIDPPVEITAANFDLLKKILVKGIAAGDVQFTVTGTAIGRDITGSVKSLSAIKKAFDDSFATAIANFTGGGANIIPANIKAIATVKSPNADLTADGDVVVTVVFDLADNVTIIGSTTPGSLKQDYTYKAILANILADFANILADFVNITDLPTENVWIITDTVAGDFTDIKTVLHVAAHPSASRKIKLEFPNIEAIPSGAFTEITSLVSVSANKATTVGIAFQSCESLTEVNFPLATKIRMSAFSFCESLTTVNFPLATKIGFGAFGECESLADMTIAINAGGLDINAGAFDDVLPTTIKNIKVTTHADNVTKFTGLGFTAGNINQ